MGTLSYAYTDYELDDRLLTHLKVAITSKLRQKEGFLLSWVTPSDRGSGRISLWMSPEIPVAYRFAGSKPPELNRVWLDALVRSAHGIRGMMAMSEADAIEYLAAAGASTAP
ncbi:hypothetical protein ACFOYW_04805 [Gryllotalpicola reticulitermitis]|uniref:DUF7882 domain-containing protein n=1 Tax=Gryllotalpicola reticulitermitis TaxID=1184153 RepID=A0ABV8Q2V2_9MICO